MRKQSSQASMKGNMTEEEIKALADERIGAFSYGNYEQSDHVSFLWTVTKDILAKHGIEVPAACSLEVVSTWGLKGMGFAANHSQFKQWRWGVQSKAKADKPKVVVNY